VPAPRFVIAGTDTDVGKTVFAAALAGALDGYYWKPIQAGLDSETDSETVLRLSGLLEGRVLPEAYRLRMAASPHIAAAREGVAIVAEKLIPPVADRSLVIEGAGGLLVPLNRQTLLIDVLARWGLPVILCARTRLGTINHSLLSIEALRRRLIPVTGVAFIGDGNPDVENTIAQLGGVRRLGRLRWLEPLDRRSLKAAFAENFRVGDFL